MPWLLFPSPREMAAFKLQSPGTKGVGLVPLPQLTLAGQGTFLGVLPAHRAALDAVLHKIIIVKSRSLVAVHGLCGRGGR